MDRRKDIALLLAIIIAVSASIVFFYREPVEEAPSEALRISPVGSAGSSPLILDMNGSIRAFWVSDNHEICEWSMDSGSLSEISASDSRQISGVAWKNYAVLVWVERGGAGRIFYIKTSDGGITWSNSTFFSTGDYPELWSDSEGIHMVYRNMFERAHYLADFRGEWGKASRIEEKTPIGQHIIPLHMERGTLIFWQSNGTIFYSPLYSEPSPSIGDVRSVGTGENIFDFCLSSSGNEVFLAYSSLTGKDMDIWAVHSSDALSWSTPAHVARVSMVSDIALYAGNDSAYIVYTDGKETIISCSGNDMKSNITPPGSEYFILGKEVIYTAYGTDNGSVYLWSFE